MRGAAEAALGAQRQNGPEHSDENLRARSKSLDQAVERRVVWLTISSVYAETRLLDLCVGRQVFVVLHEPCKGL